MRSTFHLVPASTWAAADPSAPYRSSSLETEGFIHCTDGVEALGATFDRHYLEDPRAFLALRVDLDRLSASWRRDDPGKPYPHIYGPIDRPAVLSVSRVHRGPDGRFAGLDTG